MEKYLCGAILGIASFFAPVGPLVLCAVLFVGVDFVTGVLADRHKVRAVGGVWAFESRKAWHTVTKLSLVMVGIIMAWLIDAILLPFSGVCAWLTSLPDCVRRAFWSYWRTLRPISGHDLFRSAADFLRSKFLRHKRDDNRR